MLQERGCHKNNLSCCKSMNVPSRCSTSWSLKKVRRVQNSNFDHGGGNSNVGRFREWRCMSLGNYSIEKGVCANSFVSKALVA